jgi:hypothetical protein
MDRKVSAHLKLDAINAAKAICIVTGRVYRKEVNNAQYDGTSSTP